MSSALTRLAWWRYKKTSTSHWQRDSIPKVLSQPSSKRSGAFSGSIMLDLSESAPSAASYPESIPPAGSWIGYPTTRSQRVNGMRARRNTTHYKCISSSCEAIQTQDFLPVTADQLRVQDAANEPLQCRIGPRLLH